VTIATTPDPLYIAARRVLLNAVEALNEHSGAVILVGAQAVYLQTGTSDLDVSVAPYTKDADLTINPNLIGGDPRIVDAMLAAGFVLKIKESGGIEPGTWLATTTVDGLQRLVPVDLLVPETLATGKGRRDSGLPDHGKNAARRTPGIEATLLDNTAMQIRSLEPDFDARAITIRVAGPAALFVAKAHKIAERVRDGEAGRERRVMPKDAGDVIRLMRSAAAPTVIGARLAELANDPMCGEIVTIGVDHLRRLFGTPRGRGVDLAITALAGALPEDSLRELAPSYVAALLAAYRR
jgi:hypothetical protein